MFLYYIQKNPAVSLFWEQGLYCFIYIVKLELFPYFDFKLFAGSHIYNFLHFSSTASGGTY